MKPIYTVPVPCGAHLHLLLLDLKKAVPSAEVVDVTCDLWSVQVTTAAPLRPADLERVIKVCQAHEPVVPAYPFHRGKPVKQDQLIGELRGLLGPVLAAVVVEKPGRGGHELAVHTIRKLTADEYAAVEDAVMRHKPADPESAPAEALPAVPFKEFVGRDPLTFTLNEMKHAFRALLLRFGLLDGRGLVRDLAQPEPTQNAVDESSPIDQVVS